MMTLSVRLRLVVTAALLAAPLLHARATDPPSDGQTSPDPDEALITRLQETIVDADYDAMDFSAVVDDLRERFDLNIHVPWSAFRWIGGRRDDRVTIKLKQISLATLLEMLTGQLGDQTEKVTYSVRSSVIVIAPRYHLSRNTVMKTYDITDLIESGYATRRFGNTPVLSLKLTGREFFGGERRESDKKRGRGGGGGSIFGDPGEDPAREMELVQEIVDMLQENVGPDDWRNMGGDVASLHPYNNTLIIRHTINGHRRIRAFFEMIRNSMPQPLDGEVIVLRLRADKADEWRRRLGPGYPRLSQVQLDDLLKTATEDRVLFRATTTALNGQRMWFSALTQRTVLTGIDAVVGDQSAALTPKSDFATEGLELIVLPLLKPGTQEITLDVQMAWVPSSTVQQRGVAMAHPGTSATIDQITQTMRTVSTTAKVRLDEALVLTIPDKLDDQGRAIAHEDWLIIRVSRP